MTTLSRVSNPNHLHYTVHLEFEVEPRERVRTYDTLYLYPTPTVVLLLYATHHIPHPSNLSASTKRPTTKFIYEFRLKN